MASTFLSLYSSIASSPIPHAKSNPNFQVTRCSTSFKEVEFPSLSETSFSDGKRNKPIRAKNKKKNKNKNNDKASVHTLAETFTYCIHKRLWLKALELFDMLREQPYYEPKEVTYVRLIALLGKSGQPHRAHHLFDTIKEDGCETTGLYNALIAAYCRNNLIDEAFLVLDEMKNLPHCQPDVSTYSTLIKACVNALKFELVEFLYEDMAERLIVLNTATQNIVLNGYGNAARFDPMEKLLSCMMESTACKPDVFTMNTVIGAFGKQGEIDIMEKWYDRLCNFGILPETYAFNILIGAYGKKRMYDKMSSVMQHMRELGCQWTIATYNNVIEAFADVGDAKSMEHTFDQMHEEGLKADTKTFCCLIVGYANAGIFHKVVSSVRLAARFQVTENTSFYNAIIFACAKAEDLMEMERVYKRMKEKQCKPDDTTFSVMAEAYSKRGMSDKIHYSEQERTKMLIGNKIEQA